MTTYGKSAHASTPMKGDNALKKMFAFFATVNEDCKRVYETLFEDKFGLQAMADETGNLTMSPDVAVYENGILKITVDVRFPATHSKEEVLAPFAENGIAYTERNYQAPLYNKPDGVLIKTLMKVYDDCTGNKSEPIAIGGGTYARALERGCGFGPEVPGEESTIHQPNELISFERIALLNKVYYEALYKLATEGKQYRIATIVRRLR